MADAVDARLKTDSESHREISINSCYDVLNYGLLEVWIEMENPIVVGSHFNPDLYLMLNPKNRLSSDNVSLVREVLRDSSRTGENLTFYFAMMRWVGKSEASKTISFPRKKIVNVKDIEPIFSGKVYKTHIFDRHMSLGTPGKYDVMFRHQKSREDTAFSWEKIQPYLVLEVIEPSKKTI